MGLLENAIISLVALFHLAFLLLEMFLWTKPLGLKVFRQSMKDAKTSAALAANQGLYNGFLAAGLIWSLMAQRTDLKVFFLTCVVIAGIFGAASVNRRIFFIQALPALLGLALALNIFG